MFTTQQSLLRYSRVFHNTTASSAIQQTLVQYNRLLYKPISSHLKHNQSIMKLSSLLTLTTIAVAGADAWSFTVWTGKDHHGKKRHYHSSLGDNDCYPIDNDITSKGVGSFEFCSFIWTRCSISIHSEIGCRGEKLGSATATDKGDLWPTKWSKNTSKKGSKIKSFRIQGCKHIPVTGGSLDIANCK